MKTYGERGPADDPQIPTSTQREEDQLDDMQIAA